MKKLLFIFTLLVGLIVAAFVFYKEGVLPVDKNDSTQKTIVVAKGATVTDVINTLALEKLIRSKLAFYLIIKQKGIEKKIQAGDFTLSPNMDATKIAEALTRGSLDIWVTIPEGLRKEEIAEILGKELQQFSPSEFVAKAREGYLFPDTYLIPKSANAEDALKILTQTFRTKYDQEIAKRAVEKELTESELVILASILEREVSHPEDRAPVASVFLKRLSMPMRLQVDATVQYALGYQVDMTSWWKRPLYYEDLEIDSPYNTYKVDGLPPAPISNPGLEAMRAVLEADSSTPYVYYVNDSSGRIHFARTLEEHEKNIEKYVR